MTILLERAFAQAKTLSEVEQDALAARILADLESEQRWDDLFERSQAMLEEWADEALAEHRAGKTIPVERADRRK